MPFARNLRDLAKGLGIAVGGLGTFAAAVKALDRADGIGEPAKPARLPRDCKRSDPTTHETNAKT